MIPIEGSFLYYKEADEFKKKHRDSNKLIIRPAVLYGLGQEGWIVKYIDE